MAAAKWQQANSPKKSEKLKGATGQSGSERLEEVVGVSLEAHRGLEQIRVNQSKLEGADSEIFRVI